MPIKPLARFLAKRKPLLREDKLIKTVKPILNVPIKEEEEKPSSGKTYQGQTAEGYCLECLPGDAMLYTAHSVYPIVDLGPRYNVLTHTGEYMPISDRYFRDYDGELVSVTFWYLNMPLRLTPEHPVLGVKNLRPPQSNWQKNFDGGELTWIPAGQLSPSDFIAFPRMRKTVDVGVVTEDLAELIGWYIAEGSCTKYSQRKRGYGLEFSLGKHEGEHVTRIVSLLKSCFGYDAGVTEKKTALCVQFSTSTFGEFFTQFGTKSYLKDLPQWILYLPEAKQWRVLRGMFKGDGDVAKEAVRYATSSSHLAFTLRLLLFRLGIVHGIHRSWPKDSMIDGRRVVGKHFTYLFTLGGGSGGSLAVQTDIDFKARTDKNWAWVREDYVLIPVRRVERESYKGSVYNLHVPGDQSYTTLHGSLHNCVEGHTMAALTELRHAIDRYRTAGKMTEGVAEKARIALAELQGISADVQTVEKAPPEVKAGLNAIVDDARWIRKEYGVSGKGLTVGLGTLQDLEELRDRVSKLQEKAYGLVDDCPSCGQAVGVGWGLQIAERIGMPGFQELKDDVMAERLPANDAMDRIIAYADEKGSEDDRQALREVKRMMNTPLSQLESEAVASNVES